MREGRLNPEEKTDNLLVSIAVFSSPIIIGFIIFFLIIQFIELIGI